MPFSERRLLSSLSLFGLLYFPACPSARRCVRRAAALDRSSTGLRRPTVESYPARRWIFQKRSVTLHARPSIQANARPRRSAAYSDGHGPVLVSLGRSQIRVLHREEDFLWEHEHR